MRKYSLTEVAEGKKIICIKPDMKSEKHPRAKSRGTGDPSPNSSHHFNLPPTLANQKDTWVHELMAE